MGRCNKLRGSALYSGLLRVVVCMGGHFIPSNMEACMLNVWDFTFKIGQVIYSKENSRLLSDGCVYC